MARSSRHATSPLTRTPAFTHATARCRERGRRRPPRRPGATRPPREDRRSPFDGSHQRRPAAGAGMTARLVGINHVALEVGDIEEALAFYGQVFELHLRGREPRMAFIDAGDQFIALSERSGDQAGGDRHFGLVVDDKDAVRAALEAAGRGDRPQPRARLPRPVGQPRPGRRLPRHPVHEDAGGAARDGPRGPEQGPRRAARAAREGRRGPRLALRAGGRRGRRCRGARHRRDLRIHELVLVILLSESGERPFRYKDVPGAPFLTRARRDVRHRSVVTCRVSAAVVAPEPW